MFLPDNKFFFKYQHKEIPVAESIPLPYRGKRGTRRLTRKFYLNYWIGKRKFHLEIPTGFEWDGNSIPGILWWSMGTPYEPLLEIPGLVHDFLFRTGLLGRKNSNIMYVQLLGLMGVSGFNRRRVWLGLKIGSKKSYNFWRDRGSNTAHPELALPKEFF